MNTIQCRYCKQQIETNESPTNTSSKNVMNMFQCRYCKQIETDESNLVIPCDCYKENKYAHVTCLEAAYHGQLECWRCKSVIDKWIEIDEREVRDSTLILLSIELFFFVVYKLYMCLNIDFNRC